jgi:AcrR family transcriptional regulator
MKKSVEIRVSQSRNTEEHILNESMRLFLARGYHGTTIHDITQAAGLTKGSLYWHFGSKEELLERIMEEFEKRFLNGLIHAVTDVRGGIINKFEKYFRYNAAFVTTIENFVFHLRH